MRAQQISNGDTIISPNRLEAIRFMSRFTLQWP